MAHLQNVIITETTRGRGEAHDPIRAIKQFWSTEGKLLGEVDPLSPQYNPLTAEWILPIGMKTKVGALDHSGGV